MIKSVIIDDDPFIIDLLTDKLEQFIPDIVVMGTASSGMEGIEILDIHRPDLVFLDVEMEDMTGFEMLSQLKEIWFETIFITSFRHYAIKAIRFNALDYLVKPIDLGHLKASVKRYREKVRHGVPGTRVKQALQNFQTQDVSLKHLTLQTQEGELRMQLGEIVRIEGERNYSYIHLEKRRKKLVSRTLGDFEDLLGDKGFFRCHKSHIVNALHIDSWSRTQLLLRDKTTLPIARRKKDAFKSWIEQVKTR